MGRLVASSAVVLLIALLCPAVAARQATPNAGPSAGVRNEALVEVAFPAGTLPADPATLLFGRDTIQPGSDISFPSHYVPTSTLVAVVLEGKFAIRPAGSLLVVRAGGAGGPEEVAPGQEVLLGPGDAFGYPRTPVEEFGPEAFGDWRNAGEVPVVFVGSGVYATSPTTPPTGAIYELLAEADPATLGALRAMTAGPVTVRIERLPLAPGSALAVPPPAGIRVLYVDAGSPSLAERPTSGPATPTRVRALARYQAVQLQAGAVGTARTLANEGSEPAVVLSLAIEPAESAATPGAGTPVAHTAMSSRPTGDNPAARR